MSRPYMCFPGFCRKAFTMSYDDGVEQDRRLIEIMQKNGVKGTFNLNGDAFESDHYTYPDGTIHRRMGRVDALEAFADSGMEVAIHGYTHPFLERLSRDMATYEVIKDRETLEAMFGRVVRGMAYPFGTYNDTVVDVLRGAGVAYSRTTAATGQFSIPSDWLRLPSTCHHNDGRIGALSEKFVTGVPSEREDPWLFYVWGHAYEFDANQNWEHIENLLAYIGNREDVWYATNIDIYEYIEAYRALVFGVAGKQVYNPTCVDVYMLFNGKQVKVPAGKSVNL